MNEPSRRDGLIGAMSLCEPCAEVCKAQHPDRASYLGVARYPEFEAILRNHGLIDARPEPTGEK